MIFSFLLDTTFLFNYMNLYSNFKDVLNFKLIFNNFNFVIIMHLINFENVYVIIKIYIYLNLSWLLMNFDVILLKN